MKCSIETASRLFVKITNQYFDKGDLVTVQIKNKPNQEVTGKIVDFNDIRIVIDCSKQYATDIQAFEYDELSCISLVTNITGPHIKGIDFWYDKSGEKKNAIDIVNLVKETLDEVGIPYTENEEGDGKIIFNGLTNKDYEEDEKELKRLMSETAFSVSMPEDHSEEYNKAQEEFKNAPQYIKDEYNEKFATSKHAKKI